MVARVAFVWGVAMVVVVGAEWSTRLKEGGLYVVAVACFYLVSEVGHQWKMRALERERADLWKQIAKDSATQWNALAKAAERVERRLDLN
jgi:hypothetical protein